MSRILSAVLKLEIYSGENPDIPSKHQNDFSKLSKRFSRKSVIIFPLRMIVLLLKRIGNFVKTFWCSVDEVFLVFFCTKRFNEELHKIPHKNMRDFVVQASWGWLQKGKITLNHTVRVATLNNGTNTKSYVAPHPGEDYEQ